MGWFGRGRDEDRGRDARPLTDEQAIERYRYMLATAPPEDIERAHEEAFARLTPEQRRQVLEGLAGVVPESELRGDDPRALARTATRAEMREPGTMERAFGGGGLGFGGILLPAIAGSFIGTAIASQFFADDAAADAGGGADTASADEAGMDDGSGMDGGDFGDAGGDFGDLGGF